MDTGRQKKLQNRVSRISGQIEGLRRMIDEDRYCVDILTQIAAVRSALDSLGVTLLSDHIQHCVTGSEHAHGHAKKQSPEALAEEVQTVLQRFLR
jgi:DNA-binding FrmR family transcriptional regulator